MKSTEREHVWQLSDSWRHRLEYFGGLLVDMMGRSRILCLNRQAADIIAVISSEPYTLAEISEILSASTYGQPPQSVDEVETFLWGLQARGCVKVSSVRGRPYQDRERSVANSVANFDTARGQIPIDSLSAPFEVNLYPTTRCNVDCTFCYLSKSMRRGYGPKQLDIKLLADFLRQCYEEGVFGVNFLGGEPFITPDLIEETIDKHAGDFLISITTNGTLEQRISKRLVEKLSQPGVDVIVSVHSSDFRTHDGIVGKSGAFVKAIHFIETLSNAGVRIAVQMVFSSESTAEDARTLLKLCREWGAAGFYVNIPFAPSYMTPREYASIRPSSKEMKDLSSFMNRMRRQEGDGFYVYLKGAYSFAYEDACQTPEWESPMDRWLLHPGDGGISLDVMSDGVINLGSMFFEGGLYGKVGHIGSTSLREVWRSEKVGHWRTRSPQKTIGEPCASCCHVNYCKGGNFVQSMALFGDASVGDVRCPIVWEHLERTGALS